MTPKKNYNKDLNRKRGLYFVMAVLFVLLLIYILLEWKTEYDTMGYDLGN